MKKDDLIILLIGLLLLAGMIITVIFGGEKSLHGVGLFTDGKQARNISLVPAASTPLSKSAIYAGSDHCRGDLLAAMMQAISESETRATFSS